MNPDRPAKGIRRTPTGWQVYARINGAFYSQRLPAETSLADLKAALGRIVATYRYGATFLSPEPEPETFAADAKRYLAAVRAMPTYEERKTHIELWCARFGDRPRASITSAEIRAQLHTWRQNLAASSVNHRRSALQHLWTVLDGKSAPNPVKDVPKFREPDPEPRGLPYEQIRTILSRMRASKTKARLLIIAYTGLPHATIKRLKPEHLDRKRRALYVPGRAKGKGTRGRVLPLSPQALAAFRLFHTWDAWGPFSNSAMHKAFKLACRKAGAGEQITVYDLRHSFAEAIYASGDLRATQALLGHSTPTLTVRYTLGAVEARQRAVLREFAGRELPLRPAQVASAQKAQRKQQKKSAF